MANPVHNPSSDDVLTAYLDGELDAEAKRALDAALAADAGTRARLEALRGSGRPFKESFALVTEAAPRDRLDTMLAGIAPPRAEVGAPRRFWMSAAAVVLFAGGIAIGNSDLINLRNSATNPQVAETASKTNTATPSSAAPAGRTFDVIAQSQPLADSAPKATTVAPPPGSVLTDAAPAARQAGRAADQNQVAAAEAARPAQPQANAPAPASPAPSAPLTIDTLIAAAPPPAARPTAVPPPAPSTTPTQAAPSAGIIGGLAAAGPAGGGAAASGSTAMAPATAAAPAVPALTTGTWRQVVSDYIVLTTADTLSVMPENPRLPDAVAAYGGKLQLDLSGNRLTMPMASLKDVRLYDYRGRPLVEASFLTDDRMSVVSLCIILNGQTDAPFGFEQRNGQNIVFWTAGGHGFMLAGRASREALEAIARDLAARFT